MRKHQQLKASPRGRAKRVKGPRKPTLPDIARRYLEVQQLRERLSLTQAIERARDEICAPETFASALCVGPVPDHDSLDLGFSHWVGVVTQRLAG
jgi:hypothetical protein